MTQRPTLLTDELHAYLLDVSVRDTPLLRRLREETATMEEAWSLFKREHAIEQWLEGRRLPALRRWNEAGTPGALQPMEQVSGSLTEGSHLETRDFCFPISEAEKDTNPNIS